MVDIRLVMQEMMVSNRIDGFLHDDFFYLSTEENAHFVKTQLGIADKNLSAQEEKVCFKEVFRPKWNEFRDEVRGISVSDCPIELLNGYMFEYSFHKVMNAYFESKTLKSEKRQHVIPKAYLKGFASEGKLTRSAKHEVDTIYTNMNDDFRAKRLDENLYTDLVEEMLSKIEGDFSNIDLSKIISDGIDNLYTHIVLSAFFALLFIRVPAAHASIPNERLSRLDSDFCIVAGAFAANKISLRFCNFKFVPGDAEALKLNIKFHVPQKFTLKVTQSPVTAFTNEALKPSFIAPLNKDFIILFLNPETPDLDIIPLILKQYGIHGDSVEEDPYTYYSPKENSLRSLSSHPAEIIT